MSADIGRKPAKRCASTGREVRLFWTGPPLSPYEELSLRSFVAAGVCVLLYATSKDLAVPEGVELIDAREILSGQVHQFTFADGVRSPALHSDLFRYLAIQEFGGWYADLDIVLVAKEMPRSKVYIARELDELVNGAVMLSFPWRIAIPSRRRSRKPGNCCPRPGPARHSASAYRSGPGS